jgi:hypothetical protein
VPAVRVPVVAEITKVPEVVPLVGVTLSQEGEVDVVAAAVKLSAPPVPVLVTLTDEEVGFALPWVALKERVEVETVRIGLDPEPEPELVLPYAESRHEDQDPPLLQLAGMDVRVVCALVSLEQFVPPSWK